MLDSKIMKRGLARIAALVAGLAVAGAMPAEAPSCCGSDPPTTTVASMDGCVSACLPSAPLSPTALVGGIGLVGSSSLRVLATTISLPTPNRPPEIRAGAFLHRLPAGSRPSLALLHGQLLN